MQIEIDQKWVASVLPKRPNNSHKGTFGTLTIFAGSTQFPGAAALAANAALHSGVGIVRLASNANVCHSVACQLPCCTFAPISNHITQKLDEKSIYDIFKLRSNAFLVGCGLGNSLSSSFIVETLLTLSASPTVFDADALNVLSGNLQTEQNDIVREHLLAKFKNFAHDKIITPHIGEMARLMNTSTTNIENNMLAFAKDFAKAYHCIVVLKSYYTVIATSSGNVYTYTSKGNSGLAKGGSGDVLAGIIAALLAQGICAEHAAAIGVFVHAAAANFAAEKFTQTSMLPSDLPSMLCCVFEQLG